MIRVPRSAIIIGADRRVCSVALVRVMRALLYCTCIHTCLKLLLVLLTGGAEDEASLVVPVHASRGKLALDVQDRCHLCHWVQQEAHVDHELHQLTELRQPGKAIQARLRQFCA